MDQLIPDGAIGAFNGLYYKKGRFNKAYYWNGLDWVSSNHEIADVEEGISKKKQRFSLSE